MDAALTRAVSHVHVLTQAESHWEGSVMSQTFPYTLVNGPAQETAHVFSSKSFLAEMKMSLFLSKMLCSGRDGSG